jgi:Ca2+-binding EF-hand superfamily protein
VKAIAVEILGSARLGKHRDTAVAATISMLKDADPQLRIAAIGTLRRIASAAFGTVDERTMQFARRIFSRNDANNDGFLTEEEWKTTSFGASLSDVDSDQDGRITVEEIARSLRSLRRSSSQD